MTPSRISDVPEVLLSQVVPSEEVRMVPDSPTATNNDLEEEVLSFEFDDDFESESFFAHETIEIIKMMIPINLWNFFFIEI